MNDQLRLYKCHKIVHAMPMRKEQFVQFKHGKNTLLNDNNHDEEGYLVVYSKGTQDEYTSWSPKKAFEEGYNDAQGYLTPEEHAKIHINIVQYELNQRLKDVFNNPDCDQRWLAIARTHFDQGFMALNRSGYQSLINQLSGRDKT